MKRKRPTYRRFKAVPHESDNGPKPENLERHVEVHAGTRGRLGGQTTYRIGLATSSPPRTDTEENPHVPAPPSTNLDPAFDGTCTSSNRVRPAKVRDSKVAFLSREAIKFVG